MNLGDGNELVIGVDAGGTKTVAWLAKRAEDAAVPLGRGQGGPGNPRAVGFDAAVDSIDAAIAAAFAAAGIERTRVAGLCVGAAGAGRATEQQELTQRLLDRSLAARVRVTHDAETILASASKEVCGVALIAGTGSLCWGRNAAGETARAGGWGYLFGDEGSGYWIALEGLRAAARAADGRGAPTTLLGKLQEALGAATPPELIEKVYGSGMTRDQLAQLAPLVFAAAESDAAAQTVIARAAEDLAELVDCVTGKLGLPPKSPLALSGSVLLRQPLLREQLLEALTRRGHSPELDLVEDPVGGAVVLARVVGGG